MRFRKERQFDWMRLDSALRKSRPRYISALIWCTGWAWNWQIIFKFASIHGRACFNIVHCCRLHWGCCRYNWLLLSPELRLLSIWLIVVVDEFDVVIVIIDFCCRLICCCCRLIRCCYQYNWFLSIDLMLLLIIIDCCCSLISSCCRMTWSCCRLFGCYWRLNTGVQS